MELTFQKFQIGNGKIKNKKHSYKSVFLLAFLDENVDNRREYIIKPLQDGIFISFVRSGMPPFQKFFKNF